MHQEYHCWESPALRRPMELLWYGNWGRPVLAFPTSLGGCRENEGAGLIGGLSPKIESGEVQVCCVDTVNDESWYNYGAHPGYRAFRHDQYDRYLVDEVLPLIRTKAERSDVVAYGASFGAYHAMNLACRHPETVSRVICFSGLFDIHRYVQGHWDDLCYFHCPTAYVPNMPDEWADRLRKVGFVICTGEHDSLVEDNRQFASILTSKGIPVHLEIWPGQFGHDWPWWNSNLPRFVP